MRAGPAWLLCLALTPIIGGPLLLHPTYRRYGLACRIALAGGAGAVVLSFVMTLATLAGIPWNLWGLAAVSAAICGLLRIVLGPEAESPRPMDAGLLGPAVGAGALSAVAVAAALFATLAGACGSTDLLHFWGPKAEAFAAARTIDAGFLRVPWHAHLHADYPPLVTNLFAFATLAAGRFPWGAATFSFPLVLAALALALPGLASADRPRAEARAVAALAICCAGLLGTAFQVAGNGDTILLFFEACAAAILTGPDAARGSRQLLAGLFFAGALSAKVEGLPFVVAAAGLFFLLCPRQRTARAAVLLLLPALACLGAWLAFGRTRQLFGFYEGYGSPLELHPENLSLVFRALGAQFALVARGLPFLAPVVVLLLSPRKSRMAWLPAGTALILSVFFLFTYLHTNYQLADWISWSAGRIFTPVAILLAIAPAARSPDLASRL